MEYYHIHIWKFNIFEVFKYYDSNNNYVFIIRTYMRHVSYFTHEYNLYNILFSII